MVFKWRRQLRAGLFDRRGLIAATLAPTVPSQAGVSEECCIGVIEIGLGKITVRIEGCPDPGSGAGRTASMIGLPAGTRIWLAAGVTDMRSGFNGLASKVQISLEEDPYSGMYLFSGDAAVIWSKFCGGPAKACACYASG